MAKSINERLLDLAGRYPLDETLVFGLDVGIASLGSGAVWHNSDETAIAFAGSWCFEAPEEPKTKVLKNKTRRDKRLLRRVTRRRRRRMADVRTLLIESGLLESIDPEAFHPHRAAPDPWQARAAGLDRRLEDEALAAALLHIAKHRGFKSTKKSDAGQNAPDDNKKMLGAIAANQELLAQYQTIGQMVASDAKFANRKRNRSAEYTHTFARGDLQDEVKKLFAAQRRLGNSKATKDLEERYIGIVFYQRPLQDSEDLVGMCPFEPAEKRSPRHAPSFEKFRVLAKLNTIKVREADGSLRRLTREELGKAIADFGGGSKSLTWNALATKIVLPKGASFDGIDEKKSKNDFAASKGCAAGTKTLRDALGPAGWDAVKDNSALLDNIAAIIAFREDIGRIEEAIDALDLEPVVRKALMDAVRAGAFGAFKGAGHISAKAARNILPHLLEGNVYSEACAAAGYDHTQSRRIGIDDIRNPVVRRSLREALKQVEALVHRFSIRPGRIVVELARAVGKSAEERVEITRGIEKRTAEKERHRKELKETLALNREPTEEELTQFELWKEQNYRCIYTDSAISPAEILSDATQIDHILPRSRSQDNSYANRVLCLTKANQDKKQRTPWEWKVRDEKDHAWWESFEARVNALHIKRHKKNLLKMRNFDERQQGFVERNLNDTKYAARALLSALRNLYGDEDEPDPASDGYLRKRRRLFARPGQITAILRRAWGLDSLKDRADDRHHALDALICAAARTDWLLNTLTRQYQQVETENRAKWTPWVPDPWPDFRGEAIGAYDTVFVARSERRRGRGQGHKDTIYRVGEDNGRKVTYERKAVTDLTKADLARLKDADGGNRPLAEALASWFEKGKPADDPPRSAKGDPVRKVLLKRKGIDPSGFTLGGGHVDNGDMVRVDVFANNGKFYLVPVYRHQAMNFGVWPLPPNKAVEIRKPVSEWSEIDLEHEFRFSLYPDSYVALVTNQGEAVEGYFRGLNINDAGILLSHHCLRQESRKFGSKTLRSLRKFHIDRFGGKHEIARETRTWHGAVCT